MTAAAMTPPRAPRPTENMAGSFALAVAMHALLVLALWINVQWRTQPQGPVVAELWGALPQPPAEVAPPPPPPPPPAVRTPQPEQPNADIVLQQERLKKLAEEKKREEERRREEERKLEEQKKREAEQRKQEEAKRKAEEEKRAAAQREAIRKAEQQRMLAQAGAAGAPTAGGAAGGGRGNADYVSMLIATIKPRIVFAVPEGTSPQIYADFQVDLLPTGEILAVKLLKASGLPGYDAAVERAIRRTDPFPRKRDGTVDRTVIIRFRPVDAQ